MTNKQRIQEIIDRLPDDVSVEQAIDELYFWEKKCKRGFARRMPVN